VRRKRLFEMSSYEPVQAETAASGGPVVQAARAEMGGSRENHREMENEAAAEGLAEMAGSAARGPMAAAEKRSD